jgi:hypothetical protein
MEHANEGSIVDIESHLERVGVGDVAGGTIAAVRNSPGWCGKGEVRDVRASIRSAGVRVVQVTAVIGIISMAALSSCIKEPLPDGTLPAPDIEGAEGETTAQFYSPHNPHTRATLLRLGSDTDMTRIVEAYALEGYVPAPEGDFVMSGSSGTDRIEIAMLCLSNSVNPERDVIYVAAIDAGEEHGLSPARISFDRPLEASCASPLPGGIWLETLPLPIEMGSAAGADVPGRVSARWVWDEYWSCFTSIMVAGAAGCTISCIPSIPQGYVVCYLTCVGGVAIAAAIRCTIQMLYG